jgi:hypothetical protein
VTALCRNTPAAAAGVDLIRPMIAQDAIEIRRQASQRVQLGLAREMTIEEAEALAEGDGEAWTLFAGARIVACVGLRETFPGAQAVAWAILAEGLGAAHLAVTRHARARIAASGLNRIEAICTAALDAEAVLAETGPLDAGQLLQAVMAVPSPEMRWAAAVGLAPAAVLRRFGAAGETHVLFERIGGAG